MDLFVHEEEYRGKDLIEKFYAQKLILCGAGAIGSNMAENLARQGFCDMSVIDFDRIENHNRHTQVWDSRSIGQKKVAALKSVLFNLMKITITSIDRKLEASNISKYIKEGIVIDGFDNSESRKLVTEYCQDNKIECLHVGLNTDFAEVTWNDSYRVPRDVEGLDVCEYPLARNIIMLAVVVGSESLIRFVDTRVKQNYIISLKDLKVTLVS